MNKLCTMAAELIDEHRANIQRLREMSARGDDIPAIVDLVRLIHVADTRIEQLVTLLQRFKTVRSRSAAIVSDVRAAGDQETS